jgi:hypothetical protein
VTFTYVLTMHLNQIHPSVILPHPPHLRRTISTDFILFSCTYTKYIYQSSLSFTLSIALPLSLLPTLRQDLFYLLVLHFLKCKLIVNEDIFCISHLCVYWTLIRLTPSVTYSVFIALLPYNSAAFSALRYTLFIHRCIVFQYYSLTIIFSFPLPTPYYPLR